MAYDLLKQIAREGRGRGSHLPVNALSLEDIQI